MVRVLDLVIDDAPQCAGGDAQPRTIPRHEQRAAGRRGRPLGRRRALRAHLQGEAKLAFRRAEVAGGGAERVLQLAAADERRGQHQPLHERRTGTVEPHQRHAQRAGSETRGDNLVVEVAAEERLRLFRGQTAHLHGARGAAAQHLALPHLPRLLTEEIVLRGFVEIRRQRPLALLGADDGGVRGDARRMLIDERAAPDSHSNHSFAAQ